MYIYIFLYKTDKQINLYLSLKETFVLSSVADQDRMWRNDYSSVLYQSDSLSVQKIR